ncbi:DeoR/GlpR family DNA-binding transcription regulator [Brevibacterium litoralis]|uniref:DeoR/GlpR family DNA-binding transcription regulator n=1 Tax=Brevibacterium litoralis TaxID=3138935 RepID=UPI0032ECB501
MSAGVGSSGESEVTGASGAGAARGTTVARREALLALVRGGVERVEDLAERSAVSISTVRRDLAALEAAGSISRTYGGATVATPFKEQSLGVRMGLHTGEKKAIAAAAADMVTAGATVFLDAGSTTAELAGLLRGRSDLSVVTRGPEIAILLAGEPGIEVTVVGGVLGTKSHGTTGALATEALRRMSFDLAFLGADAVDPVDGLGEPTLDETLLKELVARRTARTVVLADSSKFTRAGVGAGRVPAWADLGEGWTLVTDTGDRARLADFEAAGVTVIAAP